MKGVIRQALRTHKNLCSSSIILGERLFNTFDEIDLSKLIVTTHKNRYVGFFSNSFNDKLDKLLLYHVSFKSSIFEDTKESLLKLIQEGLHNELVHNIKLEDEDKKSIQREYEREITATYIEITRNKDFEEAYDSIIHYEQKLFNTTNLPNVYLRNKICNVFIPIKFSNNPNPVVRCFSFEEVLKLYSTETVPLQVKQRIKYKYFKEILLYYSFQE